MGGFAAASGNYRTEKGTAVRISRLECGNYARYGMKRETPFPLGAGPLVGWQSRYVCSPRTLAI